MTRRGWMLFALMSVIWGIPYLLVKVAVGGVSVPVLVFARTAVGAVILLPLAARRGHLDVLRRHWRPLAAFAACEIIGPWWLLTDAERLLSSSISGLLIAAVPIIGALLTRLVGSSQRLGAKRWTGLLVGFGGVALLAAPHLRGGDAWSLAEVLLTALGYATAPLIAARKLTNVPSLPMTAACLTAAAIVYAPAAILTWPPELPSARVLTALAMLAAVCTALAFIAFLELIREVDPARAMVFTYVNPAIAVAAGAIVLGEPITVAVLASFVLILAGSLLATAPESRRQRRPGAPRSLTARF
jgi:drug/metabolite transporter (DMT)-like permease